MTPPPAPADTAPVELDALLAAAFVAADDLPAYDVTIERWSAKYPGSSERTIHDGSGRYRVEMTFDGARDPGWIMLAGADYRYTTETTTDGFVYWRDRSSEIERAPEMSYPLGLPLACGGGWELVGVDLVGGRVADHLSCPGILVPDEYWIDRDTQLVLRIQMLPDETHGATVDEVVDLHFGPSPAALFELPEGADVRK